MWLSLSSSVSSGRNEIYPRESPVNQLVGSAIQPFTAPAVRPATMRRWKNGTMMMIGTVTTIAAAAIDPVG
jgi:hypothetical protein